MHQTLEAANQLNISKSLHNKRLKMDIAEALGTAMPITIHTNMTASREFMIIWLKKKKLLIRTKEK